MRNFRWVLLAVVCQLVTAERVGWADPAQVVAPSTWWGSGDWVDDPYAPHVTRGSTVRLGTAVGFLHGEPVEALALGVTVAVGQRFDRLAIEAELDLMRIQAPDGTNLRIGDAERLGALARYDALRIGPRWVGGNSLLSVYVEGGAAVAWNHWYQPAADQGMRVIPEDTKRVEGQVGFGFALDHRLQQPIGFPHRVGWFLGWRLALAPAGHDIATVCRGTGCQSAPTMAEDRIVERSMLFQSSLALTW